MLAHCRKQIVLFCLFTVILLAALPASAESYRFDFSAYPVGTNITNVTLPGIDFIASPSAVVTVVNASSLDIHGGAGTDLIIRFSRPNNFVRLTAMAYGSCQEEPDTIRLFYGTNQVSSFNFWEPPSGRCTTQIVQSDALFTEIHIDVDTDEAMEIWNFVINIASPVTEFSDGRINSFDAGSPVVLYPVDYGNEAMGLHVYAADGSGLLWELSPEDIPADCPNSNVLIGENGGIQLYRLAADSEGKCAFQLIAPTAEAGKFYYIIFDELRLDTAYQSWEE